MSSIKVMTNVANVDHRLYIWSATYNDIFFSNENSENNLRWIPVQLSTIESEPQRGPRDSEVDNSETGITGKKPLYICYTRALAALMNRKRCG